MKVSKLYFKFKKLRKKRRKILSLLMQHEKIYKYTPKSVEKTVYLIIFGITNHIAGFCLKTTIQQLSEN